MDNRRTETLERLMSRSSMLTSALGKQTNIAMPQIIAKRTEDDYMLRKTKVICTMGPSCWEPEHLVKMMDAGMNICRLNFSHGTHEQHVQVMEKINEARRMRPGIHLAALLDTKGPEIRTGLLKDGQPVKLIKDNQLKIITDYTFLGDEKIVACSYDKLAESVSVGANILMSDGSISLTVVEKGKDYVMCRIMNDAILGEKKNMNLPNVKVDLPCISEKDRKDILEFAIPYGCQFIAASFVQSAHDVKTIRQLLCGRGRHIKVLSKIENVEGLTNFDEILRESDGIMVARGDLGMEIPPEKVFLAQKMIIAKCNIAGKSVITATQMLESMTKSCRPTRAEAADVANAVLDGTDCVMLSGETANGLFPVEAVEVMTRVCLEAEHCIDHKILFRAMCSSVVTPISTPEAVARAAVETAQSTGASLILVLTSTGQTARLVCKYRPKQAILALSASESCIHQLQAHRGIMTLQVESFQGTDIVIRNALEEAKDLGYIQPGNTVVALHGIREEVAGNTNLMKVIEVE